MSLIVIGVAILSNAPEPRKLDPSKKSKKPEGEVEKSASGKKTIPSKLGARPSKKMNGTDDGGGGGKPQSAAAKHQVKIGFTFCLF